MFCIIKVKECKSIFLKYWILLLSPLHSNYVCTLAADIRRRGLTFTREFTVREQVNEFSKDLHFTAHLDRVWPPLPVSEPPEPDLTPPTLLSFHCQHTTPLLLCGSVPLSAARRRLPPSEPLWVVVFEEASCREGPCYDPPPVNEVEDDSAVIHLPSLRLTAVM